MRAPFRVLRAASQSFLRDDAPLMAAGIALYAVISAAPLMHFLLAFLGWWLEPADVRRLLRTQVARIVEPPGVHAVSDLIAQVQGREEVGHGWWILSTLILIWGASRFFGQTHVALNRIWQTQRDGLGVRPLLWKRVVSVVLVFGSAALLLVTLAADGLILMARPWLLRLGDAGLLLTRGLHFVSTFIVLMLGVAAVLRMLPDGKAPWRPILIGSFLTTLLLAMLRYPLALYVANAPLQLTSAAVALLWAYASAMAFLFGAECVQAIAHEAIEIKAKPFSRMRRRSGTNASDGDTSAAG